MRHLRWCLYLFFFVYLRDIPRLVRAVKGTIKSKGHPKIFVIGLNKTGTTSLERAFLDLGYTVGDQRVSELLYDRYYFESEMGPILEYCRTAQVFQDVPFSKPETYKYLDEEFPGSKFILSIRDNSDQWYCSVVRFHAKTFGKGGRIPTVGDLREARYVRPGFMYNVIRSYGTTEDDPYNRKTLKSYYDKYNRNVIEYFKDRDDLLVINVSEKGAYQKFVKFLGVESPYDDFPWENRT